MVVVLIIAIALLFDFLNGLHDSSNINSCFCSVASYATVASARSKICKAVSICSWVTINGGIQRMMLP